jgi:hypothetical protein
MTSEIKVDTISEQTSANGVTIDGLTIKDGNIIGDVALAGTTPTFTVGDGGAEDAALIFDGNAVDYYIALDDSADNLIIGSGSTVGSNSLITIDSDGDFTLDSAGDIILDVGGGDISLKGSGAEYGKFNLSGNSLNIHSSISDGDIVFKGNDGGSAITALTLDMSAAGAATFNADVTVGGTLNASSTQIITSNTPVISFIESDQSNKQYQIGSFGAAFAVYDASNTEFRYIIDTNGNHIFNEGSADCDFRVESNGLTHALFVDGGNNHVNVGTSTDHGGVLNVESTDNAITLLLASTDTDANAGPQLKLFRAVTGATNDICGKIEFGAKDDAGNGEAYALISQKILNAANGSEEARLTFQVMQDGSQRDMLSLDASEVVINEDSRDIDFRVESDSKTHMLFVDSGNDRIGVNTNSPADTMHIKSTGDPSNDIRLILETNATDGNCAIDFRNSASTFKGGILYDTDDNIFKISTNGSNERMRITSSGDVLIGRTNATINSSNFGIALRYYGEVRMARDAAGSSPCLDVYGTAGQFKVMGDGDAENTNNSYTAISDERIKTNITDANSQWNDIKAIEVKNFERKDDVAKYGAGKKVQIGVVAQQVESVSPGLVKERDPTEVEINMSSEFGTLYEDGDTIPEDKKVGDIKETKDQVKSVSYSVLYMKAIKALQEAQTRIETLETKVAALEG